MQKRFSKWTYILYGAIGLVLVLLISMLVMYLGVEERKLPSSSDAPSMSDSSLADNSSTDGLPTEPRIDSETTDTKPNESLPATGLSYEEALPWALGVREELSIPAVYSEDGYRLLRVLSDGRLILANARQVSILNIGDGTEVVVATADFGLQAVTNDRYIVFGIGGDEVFAIDAYDISTGTTTRLLADESGYFGLEIDSEDRVYTTEVLELRYGRTTGAYLTYDIPKGLLTAAEDVPHSQGLQDLVVMVPDANLTWSYQVDAPWYEAWRLSDKLSMAIEIAYTDIYDETYAYQIYLLDREEDAPILMTKSIRGGRRPRINVEAGLFVQDDTVFFDPANRRWYRTDDAEASSMRVLALGGEDGAIYAGDRGGDGLPTVLYRIWPRA